MNEVDSDRDSQPVDPLSANARRVLGVLIEKAKTTPESYPMSLAAIVTASNQKSNRSPKMELGEGDVLDALDELRRVGASREVHGSGRVTKYRHAAYDWMSIDDAESAIMTELLLRGPQTLGELRSRASRMYAFEDLQAAKAVVGKLVEKKLAEPITPPGRGQVFAHTLYPPEERQYLNARIEKQRGPTPSEPAPNKTAVDQLISRLDAVNERIEALEKRIDELESS